MDINALSVDKFDLSVRTKNCLRRAGIFTFGEMVDFYQKGELINLPNMGVKSVNEVAELIKRVAEGTLEFPDNKSSDCRTVELDADNFDDWAETDSGRKFITDFFNEINTLTDVLVDISPKAYNLLMFAGKKHLKDILFADKNELMNIKMMDDFTANEIITSCASYIGSQKENIIAAFNKLQKQETYSVRTVADILNNPAYQEKVISYLKINDVSIDNWDIGNRPKNQLRRAGFSYLSEIIFLTEDELYRLPAMGKNSVDDILEKRKKYLEQHSDRLLAFCEGDFSAIITDDVISQNILDLYTENKFRGFSFKDFIDNLHLSATVDENRLKAVIGRMLADEKLEYVDYRCYRRYPKIKDYLGKASCIEERSKVLIEKRLEGVTLEAIGSEFALTRERIRQLEKRDFEKLCNQCKVETGVACFDEDYYETFFRTYSFNKADAEKWLGIDAVVFNYMDMRNIKQGKADLNTALDDNNLDIGLKLKVKNYLNRNKIFIDGMWIDKKRSELENYCLAKFCREDVSFADFAEKFNSFLEFENIPYDEKLYYCDEVLRTRKNHLSESRLALWKQNEMIRYYDIDARDYSELLDTLNFESYENIEISTLKFMDDYPELMLKYDIRDQYELHNLLRKIVPENSYNNFCCGRTPILCFGEFDRVEAVRELILNNAPLTQEELCALMRKEYGFESGAITWKNLGEYYYQGLYRVDYKAMSDGAKAALIEKLTEDFYYIDEIKKIYKGLLPDSDLSEVNPFNLKNMGFSVLSKYAYRNYASLEAYFVELLTKSDIIDIRPYRNKFTYVQSFSATLNFLKNNKTIFEFDPDRIINRRKLEAGGVTDELVENFCDSVNEFVEDDTYFSVKTIKSKGFGHELFELGFSDWFYANILTQDGRFSHGQIFNNIIFYKGKKSITIKSFEMHLVKEAGSIDTYDLMEEMIKYGCKINEKSDVTHRLYGTEVYYDNILDRFYSSAEAYYRELDEAEGIF